jgi:cytochrome c-type biogenesis protein CcmE
MAGKGNSKWIVGGLIIAGAVVAMSFLQLGESVVYFYTPQEALAKSNEISAKTVKIGGLVVPGSVDWKPKELALNFTISDNAGHDIRIAHKGTPPDMFKEGQGVVVEGKISADGKQMQSKQLLVKHSEEYKPPTDEKSINTELLEKSMFKQ